MATATHPSSSPTRRRSATPTGKATLYQPQQASGFTIIEQAQQGVPTPQVDQLAQLLNLSLKELASILQIAERTLHRFRSE